MPFSGPVSSNRVEREENTIETLNFQLFHGNKVKIYTKVTILRKNIVKMERNGQDELSLTT
jgi:hypothetical protein